jgi:AcrR family transcriptional regulator
MLVSRQSDATVVPEKTGPRARMKRILLGSAMELMQRGIVPSVSDVAEAAEVSRATAYRYFPHQASMIQAAVGEALGPILAWSSQSTDPQVRVADLLAFAYPRIDEYEATHRATLLLALHQWTRRTAGTLGDDTEIVRGHRKKLLADAVAPLRKTLNHGAFDRLTQSLSLIFGTEAFIVLKDIWGLDGEESRNVALWAANALVRAAMDEVLTTRKLRPKVRGSGRETAIKSKRKAK